MIDSEKNSVLDALIGCRIKTHYGPHEAYGSDSWTIQYRHENEKKPSCWINSIKVENDVITCEGVPLRILGREENSQMSLF